MCVCIIIYIFDMYSTYVYNKHACTHSHTPSLSHSLTAFHMMVRCVVTSHFFSFAVVLIPTQLIQLARTPVHRYLSHILFGAMSLHVCTCRDCVLFAPLMLLCCYCCCCCCYYFSPLISRFHKTQ